MRNTEKKQELIAEALKAVTKASDLLGQCGFTVVDADSLLPGKTPWADADDLTRSMVQDTQVELAGIMSNLERVHGLLTGKYDFADESVRYLKEMDERYGDPDESDFEGLAEHDPLVFADDILPEDMDLIRKLAKTEREQVQLAKRIGANDISDLLDLDEVTTKKMEQLSSKGRQLREDLLNSTLAFETLDCVDGIEDMKKMASILFFLYSTERMRAEREDREPDEDFYYAGTNMYKHAVVLQVSEDDEDDEDDDPDWFDESEDDD